ncbi:MAG TPA: adenine phosphoribosyltransferase [Microbacteriaceae bacterium]|nr:adenine phosphoribosyltransferase [Microbacteriaceae bacterium]
MGVSIALQRAESLIASIPDYPKPGVLFRDIAPLLADGPAFDVTVRALIEPFAGDFDVVAGVDARGFILAGAAASQTKAGFLPVRKKGKLARPAFSAEYELEYGTATLQVQNDVKAGSKVLLIDDVLATGGTISAAAKMIEQLGLELIGVAVLFEIDGLGGRAKLEDRYLHTVFKG